MHELSHRKKARAREQARPGQYTTEQSAQGGDGGREKGEGEKIRKGRDGAGPCEGLLGLVSELFAC